MVTPAYGRAVAASFPDARLEILAECGHMPQVEQPARLLELVRDHGLNGGSGQRPLILMLHRSMNLL